MTDQAPAPGTPAPGTPDPAAPPAPGATTALSGAVNAYDYVPEKYRVMGADGKTLDLEQSLKKTAAGYGELHQKMVAGDGPPKDADAYEAKELPHGLDFAELRKDPKMSAWLKGAHSKGMSNAQIQHVFSGFADYLGAEHELSAQECVAQLGETWKEEPARKVHMTAADRAVRALSSKAGLTYDEVNKAYGNDPKFIRLMAAIGAEIKEDTTVTDGAGNVVVPNIDDQVAEIDRKLAAGNITQAERLALNDRKVKLFESRTKGKAT